MLQDIGTSLIECKLRMMNIQGVRMTRHCNVILADCNAVLIFRYIRIDVYIPSHNIGFSRYVWNDTNKFQYDGILL